MLLRHTSPARKRGCFVQLRVRLPSLALRASVLITAASFCSAAEVRVGSKAFTEGVILGEILTQAIEAGGNAAEHRQAIGGTQLVWHALTSGEIDAYPEYTGTIRQEILAGEKLASDADLSTALARHGVRMSRPLGFNNAYAIAVPGELAEKLRLKTISDLRRFPDLRLGFSNEFMDRRDCWPALQRIYRLPQKAEGLDHDLAYRALERKLLDGTDVYSTDAEIAYYHLHALADDLKVFPPYEAVYLYRADLAQRAPKALEVISRLAGQINEQQMIALNAKAKLEKIPEGKVAADFLRSRNINSQPQVETLWQRIAGRTREHLTLVGISLAAAVAVGIPLGVVAAKKRAAGQLVLALVAGIFTIPSLALLVFMIPLLGIGPTPAIAALFLYSLLPIVRNTQAGLAGVPAGLRESAAVLPVSGWYRLLRIELPMATPAILAGIKTAAVLNVGMATLGGLISAGGYGQPILTGIRLDNPQLIFEGAVPAALLALAAQGAFELLERLLVPRGLRLGHGGR